MYIFMYIHVYVTILVCKHVCIVPIKRISRQLPIKGTIFPIWKSNRPPLISFYVSCISISFFFSATDAACISMFLVCVHVRTTHNQLHQPAGFLLIKSQRFEAVKQEKRAKEGVRKGQMCDQKVRRQWLFICDFSSLRQACLLNMEEDIPW